MTSVTGNRDDCVAGNGDDFVTTIIESSNKYFTASQDVGVVKK